MSIGEANIRVLSIRYPEILERLNAFVAERRRNAKLADYQYVPAGENRALCRRVEGGVAQWAHGPGDPVLQAQDWAHELANHPSGLAVVWKSGLGYLPRILQQSAAVSRVILCESRLELIWEFLCRWDVRSLIEDRRFYWLIADDLESALKRLACEHPSLFRSGVSWAPGSVLSGEETKNVEYLFAELNSSSGNFPWYQDKTERAFAVISSSLSEITPAVLRGIGQCGWTPLWKQRPPSLSRFMQGLNAWREILGCVPPAALGFYGSMFSPDELIEMGKAGVARAVWYYDNPETLLSGRENECYDLALAFDRSQLEVLRPIWGENARFLSPATTFDNFQPPGAFSYPIRPVAYVGATGYRLSLPYLEQNASLAPHVLRMARSVVQEHLGGDPTSMINELYEKGKSFDPAQTPTFQWLLRQLAASEVRKIFLSAAAPYGLTIFGDAIWKKPEWSGSLVQCYAGTSLRYDVETPQLYAAAKINLSICHPQVGDGNPIRVYDVLACGGFLLGEYRPALEREFTIGQDLDMFRTPDELARKIEFYLGNEALRRDIAAHGRQTVLQNHTYRNRISSILSFLRLSQ